MYLNNIDVDISSNSSLKVPNDIMNNQKLVNDRTQYPQRLSAGADGLDAKPAKPNSLVHSSMNKNFDRQNLGVAGQFSYRSGQSNRNSGIIP